MLSQQNIPECVNALSTVYSWMCQCSLSSLFLNVSMLLQQFIPECVNAPSIEYSGMCPRSFNSIFLTTTSFVKKNLSSAAIGSSSDDRKTFLRSIVGYTGYNITCLLDLYSVSCGPFTVTVAKSGNTYSAVLCFKYQYEVMGNIWTMSKFDLVSSYSSLSAGRSCSVFYITSIRLPTERLFSTHRTPIRNLLYAVKRQPNKR